MSYRKTALLSLLVLGTTALPFKSALAYANNGIIDPYNASDADIPGGFAVTPIISQLGTYDSNPLLQLNNAKPLWGSTTSPELLITDRTPTSMLKSDNRIDENLFNISTFNSTDFHSADRIITRSQNWAAGLNAGLDYDTTRTNDLTVFGFTTTPVRHTGITASPDISHNSDPSNKWDLTGTFQNSTYQNKPGTNFTNFNLYSVTPSYTHKFSELNSGLINLNAQRYQAIQGPQSITDTIGPSIGWITTPTPRLTAQATIGAQMQRQYQANLPTPAWQTNYIFSGDVSYKDEQDLANITASRSSVPFSNGTESLLTTISGKDEHKLNERFSLNFGATYEYATYQINTSNNLQSLTTADGGLTYHITNHLDITGSYQYRYETLVNVSKAPDDHTVNLQVVFHPNAWTF